MIPSGSPEQGNEQDQLGPTSEGEAQVQPEANDSLEAMACVSPSDSSLQAQEHNGPGSARQNGNGKGKGKAPPPPPSPLEQGKGKGKGKAPPPPAGKGKAPPPPPLASKKVLPIARMDLAATERDQTLFGRKLHFVKPGYSDPPAETVFRKLEDAEHKADVRDTLLTAVFKPSPRPLDSGRRSLTGRRPTGVALLNSQRAQNMAIVFSKLKSSTAEVCERLLSMDFSDPLLNADQVDLVLGALPTPAEAKLILPFADNKETLRDVEQKVLPFCEVSHCEVRLRLLRASMTHAGRYESITRQLHEIQLACKQLVESKLLCQLFAAVLEAGNRLNGAARTPRAVRSFAIETLSSISTFKIGERSMAHFLCITLHRSDPCFLPNLLDELGSLKQAARTKLEALHEDVDAFRSEALAVDRDVKLVCDDSNERASVGSKLAILCYDLQHEAIQLQDNMKHTQHVLSTAQVYFGANGKSFPSDVFLGHFTGFLSCLGSAWQEIEKRPSKWRFSEENLEDCAHPPHSGRRPVPSTPRRFSAPEVGPNAPRKANDTASPEDKVPCPSKRRCSSAAETEPSPGTPRSKSCNYDARIPKGTAPVKGISEEVEDSEDQDESEDEEDEEEAATNAENGVRCVRCGELCVDPGSHECSGRELPLLQVQLPSLDSPEETQHFKSRDSWKESPLITNAHQPRSDFHNAYVLNSLFC